MFLTNDIKVEKPYFMKNKDWYYYDDEKRTYVIKTSAPEKAKESYRKFYQSINTDPVLEIDSND